MEPLIVRTLAMKKMRLADQLFNEDVEALPEDLTPEAEHGRCDVLLSLVRPAARRAIAIFLGREDYAAVVNVERVKTVIFLLKM